MEMFNRIWEIFSSYDPSSTVTDHQHSNEVETKTNNSVKRSNSVESNQCPCVCAGRRRTVDFTNTPSSDITSIVTRSSYTQSGLECQRNARKGFKDIFSLSVNYPSCSTGECVTQSNRPKNDPPVSHLTPSQLQNICTQYERGSDKECPASTQSDPAQYSEVSHKKTSDVDILQSTLKSSADLNQSYKCPTTITSKQEKNGKKSNITIDVHGKGFQPNSSAVALHNPSHRSTGT